MSERVLIVGDTGLAPFEHVAHFLRRAGLECDLERDPEAALARLHDRVGPVVVDCATPGAEALVGGIRADGALSGCVVLGVVRAPVDEAFAEAFAWGADEVVPASGLSSIGHLMARVAGLEASARPPAARGVVLLASTDARQRQARGRALRNVGYEVRFALDAAEIDAWLDRPEIRFAVVDTVVFPDGAEGLLRLMRRPGAITPLIAIAAGSDAEAFALRVEAGPLARVLTRRAPPEEALFAAQALLRAQHGNDQGAARLLHTTLAAFRAVGAVGEAHGFTSNVSSSGIFVRTLLVPPAGSDLWVQLRPPGSDRLVHLEVRVMWNRAFGRDPDAASPAGFGAKITGGSHDSLTRWSDGILQSSSLHETRGILHREAERRALALTSAPGTRAAAAPLPGARAAS